MNTNDTIRLAANRENLRLLVLLRWVALFGQVSAIALCVLVLDISLPLWEMAGVLTLLAGWNLVSLIRGRSGAEITGAELFLGLLFDVIALSVQLYLSGGAANPFVALLLLQVVLAAVMLSLWPATVIAAVAGAAFLLLSVFYRPLALPAAEAAGLDLMILGAFVNFVLSAGLLVFFVTRVARNLRARDARLADLRRQSMEEDHIVRVGLLAAGAAHELGTPLSSLAVILNDWKRLPLFRRDIEAAAELATMEAEVQRCKTIVSGILASSGELRGEGQVQTTVSGFIAEVAADWEASRSPPSLTVVDRFRPDQAVAPDIALKQVLFNVLDNALEAPSRQISVTLDRADDRLDIRVRDDGPGFAPEMLEQVGRPYTSTKGRPGGGLGLFLVSNVLRKLGGEMRVANRPEGGAEVRLLLPLDALAAGR